VVAHVAVGQENIESAIFSPRRQVKPVAPRPEDDTPHAIAMAQNRRRPADRVPRPGAAPRRRRVVPKQVALKRTPTTQGARTRARVIDAAVHCLSTEGFSRASTTRIADRAGLTWGVLQYHFGDKEGILAAVVERNFHDFVARLRGASRQRGPVRGRVATIIDVVWRLLGEPSYRATMEILRHAARDPRSSIDAPALLAAWAGEVGRLWEDVFGTDRRRGRSEAAKHVLFATLRGLAEDRSLGGTPLAAPLPELAALADAVTFLLEEDAPA
jgi:AcrR family transcriptional regulator